MFCNQLFQSEQSRSGWEPEVEFRFKSGSVTDRVGQIQPGRCDTRRTVSEGGGPPLGTGDFLLVDTLFHSKHFQHYSPKYTNVTVVTILYQISQEGAAG